MVSAMQRKGIASVPLLVATVATACAIANDPQVEFWPTGADAGSSPGAGGSGEVAGGGIAPLDSSALAGSRSVGASQGTGGSVGAAGSVGFGGSQVTADSGAPPLTGVCSLQVSVTTVTNNGRYSPRNVGAIWIAAASGGFVKTLAKWGTVRSTNLTAWTSATWTAGLFGNTVDAVTGATASTHQTHMATWNCADTKETIVPDGPYSVHFEMTDQNSTGPSTSVSFTKGPTPFSLSAPDMPNFKGITLVLTR
jgi:hypothetical protein